MLLFCPLGWAAEPDCSKYSEFGLSLGMSHKSVWRVMGKRDKEASRTKDSSGYRSIERYEQTSSPILVHYDGTVGKKSSAHVVSIETTFEESVDDIPTLIATLRSRLGHPTTGAANLDSGLRGGTVEWTDTTCDARVTLFRRAAPWWEPNENAEFHVRIDSLSFLQTGELMGQPVRAAGASEPARIE